MEWTPRAQATYCAYSFASSTPLPSQREKWTINQGKNVDFQAVISAVKKVSRTMWVRLGARFERPGRKE